MSIETILITGASGFLGGILAESLLNTNEKSIRVMLTDVVQPKNPGSSANVLAFEADLTNTAEIERVFGTEFGIPDTIYCMHGIMSRGAEDNFDFGMKVNVDSVLALLQAARKHGASAGKLVKFIFTSSLAVYGGPLPDVITPSTTANPQSAYGMEKLVAELYINEFTRRGFIDGRICRLPTVVVRPGAPSAATSSFLSAIIREPLSGLPAVCPIGQSFQAPELDLEVWIASPRTTVANLVYARTIPATSFSPHTRVISLPGFTVTVRAILEALERVGGTKALDFIEFKDDPTNRRIVSSWPAQFDCSYALKLGFTVDEGGMDKIIRDFQQTLD